MGFLLLLPLPLPLGFKFQSAAWSQAGWEKNILCSSCAPCFSLMDKHTLLQQFHYITSLPSLAYTFIILHTIPYAMRDHDIDNNITTSTQPPQLNCSTNPSTSSSAHDTPTTSTSENLEKTSGWWTKTEINLLLDFVEGNCILTSARGLNLKKSEFNKACTIVKSKDANQCHYKWGHVCILLSMLIFITYLYYSYALYTKQFCSGTRSLGVAGMTTMVQMHKPQVIICKACPTQSLYNKTMATLLKNAGFYAWYPASRNAHFQSCQLILPVGYAITQFCQYRGGRGRGSRSSPWFTHGSLYSTRS